MPPQALIQVSPEALMPTYQPWERSGQAPTGVLPMGKAQLLGVQPFVPGLGALTYKCLSPLSVPITGAVARNYHIHTAY